jgi:UDP-glucose 4-epimerase
MMASRIPKDSIVLVTVVNGYVGSHKADQLLEAGIRSEEHVEASQKLEA